MILWLFAILDLFVIFSITTAHFDLFFSSSLLLISAGYLIVKGLVFVKDYSALVELLFGTYIALMAIFKFTSFAFYIVFIWIGAKVLMTISAET